MGDETYNGWSNWETWRAQLWLTNDEWTYNQCLEVAVGMVEGGRDSAGWIGSAVKDWVDTTEEDMGYKVIGDEMSRFRINWDEIGEAWLEMAQEQLEETG